MRLRVTSRSSPVLLAGMLFAAGPTIQGTIGTKFSAASSLQSSEISVHGVDEGVLVMLEALGNPSSNPEILATFVIRANRVCLDDEVVALTDANENSMRRIWLYWYEVSADYREIVVVD